MGTGLEVRLDGMEITQFTYFQEAGGHTLDPVTVELTYGTERIAMYLQGVDNVYDLRWSKGVSYGDLFHDSEVQFSHYHFEAADIAMIRTMFDACEAECRPLLEKELVLPAYDYCMKSSHLFNVLDARGRAKRGGANGLYRARSRTRAWLRGRLRRTTKNVGFPVTGRIRGDACRVFQGNAESSSVIIFHSLAHVVPPLHPSVREESL